MMSVVKAVCAREGLDYESSSPVAGGDINPAYLLIAGNKRYFLKLNASSQYPQMFKKEAEGLKALRQQHLLRVPEVLAFGELDGDQYLLLEWLDKARPSADFWATFAEGLSGLHSITNACFGWVSSNYIGSLIQHNVYKETWTEFYATQRIMPLVERLFDGGFFSKAEVKAAEKVCKRLNEIFPPEAPSLLHGDLWSGNFMAINDDKNIVGAIPAVYDPAVYFGHREMDLGMSLLFGGFNSSFYEAYNSLFPLERGWKDRVSLTQLYPLLVHAILFGGGYINQCSSTLNKWGN